MSGAKVTKVTKGPTLKAVVAMASNRVIGRDGGLPWRLPADLRWFRKLTMGHPVLMGRKTMESIGRPLPGRRNIVISRSLAAAPGGFELAAGLDEAIALVATEEEASVIGGAEIYRALMPRCAEVLLSYVFQPCEGDATLPEFEAGFELVEILHRDDDFELRRYARR